MTTQEQYERVLDAVETAIVQAAELSGLRNWLISECLRWLKKGEDPNEEMIVQGIGLDLLQAFETIIDPDDQEFLNSDLYKNRATDALFGGVGNPIRHQREKLYAINKTGG
jgi:hypothetical protein